MKGISVTAISDLHGHYPELEGGDLLIVAGDLTASDKPAQYDNFAHWLIKQNYKKKIVVGGNHDNFLAKGSWLKPTSFFDYLCDSGTEFAGIKIWGSPWTPLFKGVNPRCTAFMLPEAELEAKFALIPDDTDILVTHGPPKGMLDLSTRAEKCGSQSLTNKIHRLQLRAHIFGHIHEAYGKEACFIPAHNYIGMCECQFVNCSHVNERYEPVNKPIRVIL